VGAPLGRAPSFGWWRRCQTGRVAPADARHLPPSVVPRVGWAVMHLFCRAGPSIDAEAVARAVKATRVAGDQVVTVALLGHKADIGVMALGPDLWRLRALQTALRLAAASSPPPPTCRSPRSRSMQRAFPRR
jgi:hypothetical protein